MAPEQIADDEGEAVIVGFEFTIRLIVCESTQPKELVPVAVYTVVAVGLTVTVFPVNNPGFQV